jgi:hypothetical protein
VSRFKCACAIVGFLVSLTLIWIVRSTYISPRPAEAGPPTEEQQAGPPHAGAGRQIRPCKQYMFNCMSCH